MTGKTKGGYLDTRAAFVSHTIWLTPGSRDREQRDKLCRKCRIEYSKRIRTGHLSEPLKSVSERTLGPREGGRPPETEEGART